MDTIKINTFLPDGTQSGEMEMAIDNILNLGKFSYFMGLCRKSDKKTGTAATEAIKAEIITRIAELKDHETGEYKNPISKEKGEKLEKKLLVICPELKQAERKLKLIAKNQLYFIITESETKEKIVHAHLGDKYKTPDGLIAIIEKHDKLYNAIEEKTGTLIKRETLKEIKKILVNPETMQNLIKQINSEKFAENIEIIDSIISGDFDRDKIKIDTNDPEKIALINMYLADIYNAAADTAEEEEQAEQAEEPTETTQEKQEKECTTMKENTTNTAVQAETMPEILPEQTATQNNAKSVKWSDCIDNDTDYQFYPSPKQLADKIVKLIDWREVRTCLDPSAGKGDLLNAVRGLTGSIDGYKFRQAKNCRLEAVEIVPELCAILEKSGYITENADFLEWETMAAYDAIVMNPPFRQAEKHVLKALKMLETGGQLAAIINAETIENPCTNARKDLLNKLTEYNAKIEFIENAFAAAERKTNVKIAMIYVNIPAKKYTYDYFAGMDTAHTYNTGSGNSSDNSGNKNTELAINDIISNLLTQYKNECQASLYILRNYNSISALIPELSLHLSRDNGSYTTKPEPDKLLQVIRLKYWRLLFLSDKVTRLLTDEARENFRKNIDTFGKYEFNIKNIYKLLGDLSKNLAEDIEKSILKYWKYFTYHSSMCKNSNIHYYNGWKTNNAYKINNKIIYDICAHEAYKNNVYGHDTFITYISEVHKIFVYLNGGKIPNNDQRSIIDIFKSGFSGECYQGEKIHFPFFDVVFYLKGTAHITFLFPELVKRWNIIAGKHYNFLPDDYGQTAYSDLTKNQKAVADSFDGGEAGYNDTHANYNFYAGCASLALTTTATDTPTYKPIQAAAEPETRKEICFEIGKKYMFRKTEYITIISRDDKNITFAVNDDKQYTKTITIFDNTETIKNNRGVTLCWANKPYDGTPTPTPDPEPEKPDTFTESDCTTTEADTTAAETAETETRTEAAAEKTEPDFYYDVNGRRLHVGQVVKLSGCYYKSYNGLYFIAHEPGGCDWCGSDFCLRGIKINGELIAHHKTHFYPVISFTNDQRKAAEQEEHDKKHAKIEIIPDFDKLAGIISYFRQEYDRTIPQYRRMLSNGFAPRHINQTAEILNYYAAILRKFGETAENVETVADPEQAAETKAEPEQKQEQQQKPEQKPEQHESMSTDWDNIQFSQIDGLPDPENLADWGGTVFDDMPEFPDPETLPALPDTVPETSITKFEPDKIYSAVHITNSDYISAYRIIKRTAKFVTIEHSDGKTSRHKITVIDGCEVIYPDGVYSMCIVLRASDTVAAGTPRQAEQDYNRQQQERTRQAVQAAQIRHKITRTGNKITMISGAAG